MTSESGYFRPGSALVPSTQWLAVPLEATGHSFWVWFFPSNAPQTIAVKLPWEQLTPAGVPVSLFSVLRSLQVQPAQLRGVQIGLQVYPVGADFALNSQLTGAEGMLSFLMAQQVSGPPMPPVGGQVVPQPGVAATTATRSIDEQSYRRADADWKSTLYLETQANTVRKQLGGTQSRLTALNKDLPPDEKRSASRQDLADWADARRFLRDAAAKVARYIKEYDMGVTSSAGRRNWMEQSYEQYIRPRQPFAEMDRMFREFETYRKLLQHLVNSMTSAQAFAVTDGEARAKQVLSRVKASVRSKRTKQRGKK